MIEISNLRKYTHEGLTRLEADINFTDVESPYAEKTIYFEVDAAYGDMFADDTYDAFVLVPLYLAMYHKQDLHICGNISKKLYQNIKWYIPKIFCDFSDALSPVEFIVDGFSPPKPKGNLIGAGISCGVDSLSTIYDHFINETDLDYRINALFLFNSGTHGNFEDPSTQKFFQARYNRNINAADELGLPVYTVTCNLHAFTHKIAGMKSEYLAKFPFLAGAKAGYLGIYSCIFSLQNSIRRYYFSNGLSYEQIKKFSTYYHDYDMVGFCELYLVPLIQTERLELIIDGCQYRRVDKLKKIADWDIAQKYLNVCLDKTNDASNCSVCPKCLMTLMTLEILGKLDEFSDVFDVITYRRMSSEYKIRCQQNYGKNPFETENIDFACENNFPMPTLEKK